MNNAIQEQQQPREPRLNTAVGIALVAAATAWLLACGVFGVGRSGEPLGDFSVCYAAGQCCRDGINMYDTSAYSAKLAAVLGERHRETEIGFGYAPQFAIVARGFAALSYSNAKRLVQILEIAGILCIGLVSALWVRHPLVPRTMRYADLGPWLVAAIVIASPFAAHNVWMGQTTGWTCALALAGWYLAERGKVILGGMLLGMATIKPNMLILPFFWLLLERRWRTLLTASGTALLMGAYAFVQIGFLASFRGWLAAMSGYQTAAVNALGFRHVVGLPSALVAAGLPPVFNAAGWLALTLLGVTIVWHYRRGLCPDDILGLLMLAALGFVLAHDYELLYLAPALTAAWLHAENDKKRMAVLAVGVILMYIPQRIVTHISWPLLSHWRTLVVVIAFFLLLRLGFSGKKESAELHRSALA
jgi:hypothetical protein